MQMKVTVPVSVPAPYLDNKKHFSRKLDLASLLLIEAALLPKNLSHLL
jgi:hypothetical protein